MITPIISIIAGVWLMCSPSLFNVASTQAVSNFVCGPLIIAFSIISLWEVNRNVQKINILVALSFIILLLFTTHQNTLLIDSNIITGVVVIILSLFRRRFKHNYGGGWISLFQKSPAYMNKKD